MRTAEDRGTGLERVADAPPRPTARFVAYERVSTARQDLSGLGLEAQRQMIDQFARSRSAAVLARFTEVESG